MSNWIFARRILLVMAVLGMVLTPLGTAAAVTTAAQVMADMPDDMSCCPKEQRQSRMNCAVACPLLVRCTPGMGVALLSAAFLAGGPLASTILTPGPATKLLPLSLRPPSRPPRP